MLRPEERLAVNEEGREENLQTVVERGSCGEQEVEDQQHHRDDKVVGNDGGDHDKSEGKEEQGEHPGNFLSQFYDLTENTIEELPDQCKSIFKLSRINGLKNQEIADKLDISVRTVETQIYRALKILKSRLKDYLVS